MNRGRIIAYIKPSHSKKDMGSSPQKRSALEELKENSEGLVAGIPEAISDTSTGTIPEDAAQLLKFHGIYHQIDRDTRIERRKQGLEPDYQFMVRTRLPGGKLTADQYLLLDRLSDLYGNGTLRLTTRQTIQFHGIHKQDLKPLLKEINSAMITSYGACGDVCRNVMSCPVDDLLPGQNWNMQALAEEISNRFLPNSTGYFEVWCDGERFDGKIQQPDRSEPFYGNTYMPRKYKVGMGRANDNCVDLLTHDVGIEVETGPDGGEPTGFVLNVGGGLGSHHAKKATFPRLADRLGRVRPDQLMQALEVVASIQRDFGDRENRRHARMKYLLEDRGIDWFRQVFSERAGFEPEPAGPRPEYHVDDHLGWHEQKGEGLFFVGIFIENGRIQDRDESRQREGLRTILSKFPVELRITAQQNLILSHVLEKDRPEIERLMAEYGLRTEKDVSTIRRWAMACVAMPTCGLALAEAERYMPSLIDELEQRGYGENRVWIRMSGCPNACSRPPAAELGIIGRNPGTYAMYVGGSFEGTRIADKILDLVKEEQLPDEICRFIDIWHAHRASAEEGFGDFCHRVGHDALLKWREEAAASASV